MSTTSIARRYRSMVAFVVGGEVAVGLAGLVGAEDFAVGVVIGGEVNDQGGGGVGAEGDAGVAEVGSVLPGAKL